jgi:hypothetical protein
METNNEFSKYPKFLANKIQDRRTRVFALIKRPDACFFYRILTPFQQLTRQWGWQCRYNTIDPLPHQIQAGIPATIDVQDAETSLKNLLDCHMENLEWADVIEMQRPTCEHHLELMRYIQREMKKPVVVSGDDNYIDVPQHNPGYVYFRPRAEFIKRLFGEADLLTVTTIHLADIYRPLRRGRPIIILPNSINFEVLDNAPTSMEIFERQDKKKYFMAMRQTPYQDELMVNKYSNYVEIEIQREIQRILTNPKEQAQYKSNLGRDLDPNVLKTFFKISNKEIRFVVSDNEYANEANGKTIIGWSGSPTHSKDLAVITNPLMKIMRNNPDLILGMWGFIHQDWLKMMSRDQLWLYALTPVKYYYSCHKQIGFSISLAPVDEDEFTKGKSNLKSIEACALGQYSIASSYVTYDGVPPDVPRCKTEEEWHKAIMDAVNDEQMRFEVCLNNRKYVEEHFNMAKNAELWKEAYEGLL